MDPRPPAVRDRADRDWAEGLESDPFDGDPGFTWACDYRVPKPGTREMRPCGLSVVEGRCPFHGVRPEPKR